MSGLSAIYEDIDVEQRQHVSDAFSKAARHYDNHAHVQRQSANDLLDACDNLSQAKRVLDIGCGTGVLSKLCAQLPELWINLDISADMLKQSRQHTTEHFTSALCADANALPLADKSIDTVVSNMALQWCHAPETCLQEIYRVLESGGRAVLGILVDESFSSLKTAWANTNYPAKLAHLPTSSQWLNAANKMFSVKADCVTYIDEADSTRALLKRINQVGAGSYQHTQDGLLAQRFSVAEARALEMAWQALFGKRYILEYRMLHLHLYKQ